LIENQSQYDPPADPVFKDKNKCVHTYVSPRVAYDMGLEHPLECPKGSEEPSAYKEEKKGDAKPKKGGAKKEAAAEAPAAAAEAPAAPEAKAAPEESSAVMIRFVDGYETMVEESGSFAQGPDFSKPPTPTFKDKNGCNYDYVSPNPDLMQPDPTCAKGKPE